MKEKPHKDCTFCVLLSICLCCGLILGSQTRPLCQSPVHNIYNVYLIFHNCIKQSFYIYILRFKFHGTLQSSMDILLITDFKWFTRQNLCNDQESIPAVNLTAFHLNFLITRLRLVYVLPPKASYHVLSLQTEWIYIVVKGTTRSSGQTVQPLTFAPVLKIR